MGSDLGRWLLIGLILLIAVALAFLALALFNPVGIKQVPSPTVMIPHTYTPVPSTTPLMLTATPTPISSPSPSPTPIPSPTPLPELIGYNVHVVAEGETLAEISGRYGSLVPAIASLNRFSPEDALGTGQPLVIPLYAGQGITKTIEIRGLEVERGLPGRRVALTFDAGADSAPATSILDTLQQRDVQVTFFLTGKWAEENPELARRISADGHEIANHTYNHPRLSGLDDEQLREEVEKAERTILELADQTTRPFLRPPFGDSNQRVLNLLAQEGYISIYWTVDSFDSIGEPKTADFLLERVTHPTTGRGNPISLEGAIILMHVGNESTAEALPSILDWFQQNDWQVVKVSEILRPE